MFPKDYSCMANEILYTGTQDGINMFFFYLQEKNYAKSIQ